MEKQIAELTAESVELLDLGVALGENLAFGLMAGRCSAAQASTLKRIREEGKYQKLAPWRDFCTKYLKMSGSQADHIIRLLDEFGSGYFELAQLVRISPATYRAIEPSIENGALHCDGEAIELNPENAQKVAAAVADLRRALPSKEAEPPSISLRLVALEHRCGALVEEFNALDSASRGGEDWPCYTSLLARLRTALDLFGLEDAA